MNADIVVSREHHSRSSPSESPPSSHRSSLSSSSSSYLAGHLLHYLKRHVNQVSAKMASLRNGTDPVYDTLNVNVCPVTMEGISNVMLATEMVTACLCNYQES